MKLSDIVAGTPKTTLLYFNDSYLKEFEGKVLKCVKEQGKSWYIILDQSAFHPKGGGQPTDTGKLIYANGTAQVKKAILESAVVVHYVKLDTDTPPAVGERVKGVVDWETRYKYMRRHTAAHLFDHCVNKATGRMYRTMGSWLGEPKPYVEYAGEPPTEKALAEAELLANNYVKQGLGVAVDFVDRSKLQNLSDAPNIERLPENDVYRVVRINGFESIPCGGTHVKTTSEIKHIKTLGVEPISGGFRVYFDVKEVSEQV
ncbi:MAG: alanyl-tRNA editing protein [Thermoprotei archaeon]